MNEKDESIVKISISKQAEEVVSQVVNRVNDGFDAGRVSRQDVASWVLTRFIETFSDVEVQQIRAAFFNEIALLEAILKKAKQSGGVPIELKSVLLGQMNMTSTPVKKPKKALTKESINDGLRKDEDAA